MKIWIGNDHEDFETSSVSGCVDGNLLNATDTCTIDDSESDVALFAPIGVPRVLDEPVFKTGGTVSSITNGEDSMIEVGTTGSGVEDTRAITLPSVSIGLNKDGKRRLSKGGLHLRDVILRDILVGSYIDTRCLSFAPDTCLPGSVAARSIWVVRFQLGLVRFIVVHGSSWISTIAAV